MPSANARDLVEPSVGQEGRRVVVEQEDLRQRAAESAQLAQRTGLEALHEDRRRVGSAQAVAARDGEERLLHRLTLVTMEGRLLELGIDAGSTAGGAVEPGDQLDHLFEGGNREARGALGEPTIEALAHAQPPHLLEREVDGVVAAVGARAAGEDRGDVGGGLEIDVVQTDERAVACAHQVGLDVVRALAVRQRIRLQGVLGQIAAGAAVADDEPAGWRRRGRGCRVQGGHQGEREREPESRRRDLRCRTLDQGRSTAMRTASAR